MMNQQDNVALTTYVAGELDAEQLQAVEARLAGDPAGRAETGAICRVVALLRMLFQSEAAPRLAASQREAIEARTRRRRLRLPLAAGLAAAAAILVAAGIFMFAPKDRDDSSTPVVNTDKPTAGPAVDPNMHRPIGTPPSGKRGPTVGSSPRALKIPLPPPMFGPTPTPIRGEPNMGPARKGKRPPFLAPAGTVNLARGKPVTSSDPEPLIGELKLVTDGSKEGRGGYFVELGIGKQWVMIDLQAEATIYAIVVWHYHNGIVAYRDVVVQVGQDQDFIEYKTVYNNDHDNSAGQGKGKQKVYMEDYQGKLIDCKGVRGRFVRLWSNENTTNEANHYIEVEVYGKPAE